MMPTFDASLFCPMYCADAVPCAGSEKQTRNTLSYFTQSAADPEGVI